MVVNNNTNSSSRKKENLKPEELWKRVSQHLSTKKQETSGKSNVSQSNYDFSSIAASIEKVTAEKLQKKTKKELFTSEIKNSLINAPLFKEIEFKYDYGEPKKTPQWFPHKPLYIFENPSFYKKFDFDTLFFIFYHCKGSIQQTHAATRLKQESWRFHLKYKMWFQRLDEPKLITPEYEKGEFIFFDYETTWNYMKKNDFVFEYYYLEQREHF